MCCGRSSMRSRSTARRWCSWTRSARWSLPGASESNPHHKLQQFVQQLGMLMTSWQATTFLIGEYFVETDANPVFTVADGLIWLRQSVQRNSMVRKIEVMKMRGQPTLPGLHTFRISAAGIKVFAPAGVGVAKPAGPACHGAGAAAVDGRAGPGRDARRRIAAGLFGARGRAFRFGQEHPGRHLPGRRRALRAKPASSPPSSSTRTGRATACSSTWWKAARSGWSTAAARTCPSTRWCCCC